MKTPAYAVLRGGPRPVGRMDAISSYSAPMLNHGESDFAARTEELTKLVNGIVAQVARQLMVAVPPAKRTEDESNFLKDCARAEARRVASDVTLARLLAIGRKAEPPYMLSEAVRQIEASVAPIAPLGIFEAIDAEQEVDAALDIVQLKARDGSRARMQQITEVGPRVIHAVRRMVDAASRALAARPAGVA